jgi:hypothetical protein
MSAAPQPLNKFEKQLLEMILTKLKPTLDAAAERAKERLRDDIGPEDMGTITKIGDRVTALLRDGLPPLSSKIVKLLTGGLAILGALGLYQAAKSVGK